MMAEDEDERASRSEERELFAEVQAVRQRLVEAAREVDRVWGGFISSRAEIEQVYGAESTAAELTDPVRAQLDEALLRLERSSIDVVVAGFLKRGKSTMLNALLGAEVSAMKVTPATARPVEVSYGPRTAWIEYLDSEGRISREDADPVAAAAEGASRVEADSYPRPVRVLQQVPSPMLRANVVLKDTPGLDDSDPALTKHLEELTYAELDNAAATVFVICSPPGLSGSENDLLGGLDVRRVDKVFLVCNFWSDQWDSDEDRAAVVEHVRSSVCGAAASAARVFPVNAKRAWRARLEHDDAAYEASGMAELERRLEEYLTRGALRDLLLRGSAYLEEARSTAVERIAARLAVLRSPERLEDRRSDLTAKVKRVHSVVDGTCASVEIRVSQLADELASALVEPFEQLQGVIASATTTTELGLIEARFNALWDTALARASLLIREELSEIERDAKRELQQAFGEAPSTELVRLEGTEAIASIGSGVRDLGAGVAGSYTGTGLAAGAGAIIGGSLAGGAGVALLAAGPVGWIAGAAIGALLVGSAARAVERDHLPQAAKARMVDQIERQKVSTTREARATVERAGQELVAELRARSAGYGRDVEEELQLLEAVLRDGSRVAALERQAEAAKSEMAGLDLSVPTF